MLFSLFTIILYLTIIFGFGHTLIRSTDIKGFERFIIKLAVGLGSIPPITIILNYLHIPLHWTVYLAMALAVPLNDIRHKKFKIKINKYQSIILIIFIINLIVYSYGSFKYPWLEDDDPWSHAASIKYIATEKNITVSQASFQYINPYPPGYPVLFALMHQINPNLNWIMKFFNSLIISLGFLFFYLFSKEFIKSERKAVLATFCLTMIPCYLSHFIWAHAMIVTLIFPTFYLLKKAQTDKKFIFPAAILLGGTLLVQPTQNIKLCILLFLFVVSILSIQKRLPWKIITTILIGITLSCIWWGPRAFEYNTGSMQLKLRNDRLESGNIKNADRDIKNQIFSAHGGSGTRPYTWHDHLIGPNSNKIDNPIGIGPFLSLLSFIGIFLLFKKYKNGTPEEKIYALFIIFWFLFAFLGTNSATFDLPIGLFAYRFWMLLAIPISLLSAETLDYLIKKKESNLKFFVVSVMIGGIISTSGMKKLDINTSYWPYGVYWNSFDEVKGYLWLKENLPFNTKVFSFTDNLFVIGNNMSADYWTDAYKSSFKDAFNFSSSKLSTTLIKNNYKYLIIDERTLNKFGREDVEKKINELQTSRLFLIIHEIPDKIWIFKVL